MLRGPKVFKGYWRDPDATATAFAGGWFHTGDIGVLDDDGYLFIVDRLKDMIVSGGENIASSEIERVLYEHESVVEAAVVGRPDDRWGEVPVAYVVAAARPRRRRPTSSSSTAAGSSRASRCRRQVMLVDALPREPVGQGPEARAARADALSSDAAGQRVPSAGVNSRYSRSRPRSTHVGVYAK